MKKNIFLFVLFFAISTNFFAQEKIDSSLVFKMTSTQLDSFFLSNKFEKLNFQKIDRIIIAKLKNGHLINKASIGHIDYRGIRLFHTDSDNCDSLLYYHLDSYVEAAKEPESKVNFLSYKYIPESDVEYKCRTNAYLEKKNTALTVVNEYLKKKKAQTNLEYAKSCNHIANFYMIDKQFEKAQFYISEVLHYKLWFEFDLNVDSLIREEYIKAGKNLLEIRKGDLKALERTFFDPYAYDELQVIKEQYIKELGGEFKLFDKESILEMLELQEKAHKQIKN